MARIEQLSARPPLEIGDDVATIGKSLRVQGELTGSGPLYVDGRIEGAIYLPNDRITIRADGQVTANVVAREIVVLGKVRGNCQASDRVEIRRGASVTGDITTARLLVEDGAFFKGGIDIRQSLAGERQIAIEGTELAALYDARAEESIKEGRYHTITEDSDVDELLTKRRSLRRAFASSTSSSRTAAETH